MADYQGSLTGAQIDALPTQIGTLSSLQTQHKDSLVNAINDLVGGSGETKETVSVTLSPASGTIDYTGSHIEVTVDGTTTNYNVSSEGTVVFKVDMGKTYTIHYPVYVGFASPDDESKMAALAMRYITKTFDTLASVATSVVLEESSDSAWTKGGLSSEIDSILGTDGSWVIDEVHKKRAKLSASNGLEFEDGTAWSGAYGNAFRHIAGCYHVQTTNANNQKVLHMSRRRISDKTFPDMWIGTYKGNVHDSKLWSQPNVAATGSQSITQFFNLAQAQSTDYGLVGYLEQRYLVALHLMKFGTTAVEGNMGGGLQSAGLAYYNFNTGATVSLGDGTGEWSAGDGTTNKQNKLFGIEALTGQQWEFRPNIYGGVGTYIVYKGNQCSSSITEGHADYLRTLTNYATSQWTYIKNMALGDEFDVVPANITGSSSVQDWTDAFYSDPTGIRVVLFGGPSSFGSGCGLGASCSYYGWSDSNAFYGSRLAFRGDISDYDIVSGAELAYLNS